MARGRKRSREFWIGGIEEHGRKFRFKVYGGDRPGFKTYETREAAERAKRAYERQAAEIGDNKSVQEAMNQYEVWKRDPNGGANRPRSVDTVVDRLNSFFPEKDRHLPLYRLNDAKCQELYKALTERVAVDTHRGTLTCVKTFLDWCIKLKKWIKTNPAKAIEGTGKRKKGEESKPQLRIDEVRRFTDVALWLCTYGADVLNEEGGRRPQYGIGGPAAALVCFFLGLRADEVASRQVRDLDDGGRVLWVTDTKTEAGKRVQQVPEFLQPILRELTMRPIPPLRSKKAQIEAMAHPSRKASTEKLFGGNRWWVRDWVQRICELAGTPIVCAHAMRGLHITLSVQEGETAHAVTRAVGHEYASFKSTTLKHYAQPGAHEAAIQNRVVGLIRRPEKTPPDPSAEPSKSAISEKREEPPEGGDENA